MGVLTLLVYFSSLYSEGFSFYEGGSGPWVSLFIVALISILSSSPVRLPKMMGFSYFYLFICFKIKTHSFI